MTKFNDGDIIEYLTYGDNEPSGDFYTVINNGTSITGTPDHDYTYDEYDLVQNVEHFRLVEPAPVFEWIEASIEDMAVLDKFGIKYDIQETISIWIKGGK